MKSVSGLQEANVNGLACDMAEKLGLGPEIRELKLGSTFRNEKSTSFHTLKYDFKPASVDATKVATVEIGQNNTATVTVPHLDGAAHTVFKGSHKPYHKECVLIIDKNTGEITLERLTCNIQVKKTRSESKALLTVPSSTNRPITPIEMKKSPTNGRTKSRTKVASGKKREPSHQLRPKNSPQRASHHGKSPPFTNSHPTVSTSIMPSSTLAANSLPVIGENDDFSLAVPSSSSASISTSHTKAPPRTISPLVNEKPVVQTHNIDNAARDLSDSSSSDSSSDSSDSDSDSDHKMETIKMNGHATNGAKITSPSLSMPANLLSQDLQLSESESDSD